MEFTQKQKAEIWESGYTVLRRMASPRLVRNIWRDWPGMNSVIPVVDL